MKHFIALSAALAATPLVHAHAQEAQPATPATPVTPVAAPAADALVVDPAIAALLDKSVEAHKALNAVSMHFVTTKQSGETTSTTSGNISWLNPDKARLEVVTDKGLTRYVADGEKFSADVNPTTYKSDAVKGLAGKYLATQSLATITGFPAGPLAFGTSFLKMLTNWQSVSMLPDGSVSMVGSVGKAPNTATYAFKVTFAPTDNLIRRVEVTQTVKEKVTVYTTTFSDIKVNPEFAPANFTYTPAAGAKLYVAPPNYDPKLVVGATPYALKAKDLSGKTHSWDEYKGKVVLLDFWATWCGPCIGELPNVLKNYATYNPKGFEIIGVSLDNDAKALNNFVKTRDLKYVNLFDNKGWDAEDAKNYGVRAIPFTLLIGKDGKIAAVNPRGAKLEPAILAALGESPAGGTAATVGTPTVAAAPATAVQPATNDAAFEPAARALLAESAKAYSDLNGLSMHFASYNENKGKTSSISGDIAFSRPDKARTTFKMAKTGVTLVSDGSKFYMQGSPTSYRVNDIQPGTAIASTISGIPSIAGVPLSMLVDGKNPLDIPFPKWNSASLLEDNGVKLTLDMKNGPSYVFRLYLNPTDKLLRRVEVTITNKGDKNVNLTSFTSVKANPDFAPDTFTYSPPSGVKLAVDPPMYDPKLVVGAKPYALKGKDLNGKGVSWNQYKGKVVLLDFWATWCGPCIGELPNVLSAYKTYKPKGFEIVGVSLDSEKKALTDFIKARNLKYTNLFDGKGWQNVDGKTYGVQAIPFTLLIGKDGKIAAVNPRGEKLEPAIKAALAKK
jgi:peroxiredoxin/outer membrane lipoprotein-sorting protein